MEVTVGGDRLGSGKKITQDLHNYGMNSFNQERDWKSSMAPGILYPCFKEIGANFGTFDIDVDSFVRTLPTKGPLFGSFKLQVDFFNCPFRLYQGILHNNPIDIGMNMHRVYLPKIRIETMHGALDTQVAGSNFYNEQINESALMKYLGLSGIGRVPGYKSTPHIKATRKIQCVPVLAYYDIFKNYYSNKQEEKAYVITPGNPRTADIITRVIGHIGAGEENEIDYNPYNGESFYLDISNNWTWTYEIFVELPKSYEGNPQTYISDGNLVIRDTTTSNEVPITETGVSIMYSKMPYGNDIWQLSMIVYPGVRQAVIDTLTGTTGGIEAQITIINKATADRTKADIELTPFALKNIDNMRAKLLSNNELGSEVQIANISDDTDIWGTDSGSDGTGLPYSALVKQTNEGITWNAFEQNGLLVKTYQSDIFNNWLDNTFVDQITNRVKIDTSSGFFTPDTLILQEKIYSLLNRILVSGGTYYDWQEATYGEGVMRMCEVPMYFGGMSAEVMFEEVVSSSETKIDGDRQALGSLGGKGTQVGKKGGENIHVRMEEPGYIMAIVSLTPRISYNQGNDWDLTELNSLDDLHKPELDQIGFQDMMVEQLAWWNTRLRANIGGVSQRDSYGKQIAWINYQTSIDKSYGDFAKQEGYAFMVLNRNYEKGDGDFEVKDITTYIDPAKYNYAFAYTDLASQNFWVQLHFKVTSRRKMGAQQLPSL